MAGRISLLVDSPLRDLALLMRQVPGELRRQIGKATKSEAKPIWFQEVREYAHTLLQQRVIVNSADVSVTARNVTLKAGAKGRRSNGTPNVVLIRAAEFGMGENKEIQSKTRKGKAYKRRAGNAFGPSKRSGNAVYPAVSRVLTRIASLWVQTAHRTIHEKLEEV